MSVFLSPVGGAGAQFFDNNGNPLTGGKLYTYAAGTTTPQATYTSSAGSTFHTNPIVLDAAGRVPGSSEIWLTDSTIYKFVLKTSDDVLLATWDQITGVNSNFVNFTAQTEVQTATAGQTVFTLTSISYQPGTGSLTVFVDGVNQYEGTSYLETDGTTVTFTAGLHVGALVKFTTAVQTTGNATDAAVVTYTAPYTGAVTYTVEDKLAQVVSVKDFGAVGDGVTDDTAAIQAAINYAISVSSTAIPYTPNYLVVVKFPAGRYLTTGTISLSNNSSFCSLEGDDVAEIYYDGTGTCLHIGNSSSNGILAISVKNLKLTKKGAQAGTGLLVEHASNGYYERITVAGFAIGIFNKGSINCVYDFKRRSIQGCQYSFVAESSQGSGGGLRFASNLLTIRNAMFQSASAAVFTYQTGAGVTPTGSGGQVVLEYCTFEGIANTATSIYVSNFGEVVGLDEIVVKHCWFEYYGAALCYLNNSRAKFENCFISGGGGSGFTFGSDSSYLKLDSVYGYFLDTQPTGNYLVGYNAIAGATSASLSNLTVVNCSFQGLDKLTVDYPAALSGTPSNINKLNLPTQKVYRLVYDENYPSGNNNNNWGLVLNLKTETDKLNGTVWNFADVVFSGTDGIDDGYAAFRVFETGAFQNLGNNVAYTVSGTSVTFTNDGTGRWYQMRGTYIVY